MNTPPRVAVADDERDIREFLQEALTRLGWQVTAAATGRQLLEACRRERPDLIVTDIRMPDMDGIEAALAVNADASVPVILVSAFHDAELLKRLEGLPVFGFLVKPISETHLKTAVAVAMTRYRQFDVMRRESADLRQALEDRKVVERAKGVLMRRLSVDEDEAYRRLRKLASNKNLKLIDMGRHILAAEAVFTELDGV